MPSDRIRVVALVVLSLISLLANAQADGKHSSTNSAVRQSKSDQEIHAVYDAWAKAFKAKDLDGIMAVYAPGDSLVAYDVVPPLQYVGKEAYRKDYQEFLAMYEGPIDIEYRDLRIMSSGDLGIINALERMSGTLKNGQKSDIWLRATSGLRKINGKWLIVHDHISVPADFETGKAALDLKP